MIRLGLTPWLVPALAAVTPAVAAATPPPPNPIATYGPNQTVCTPSFAIVLIDGERANLYSDTWLSVTTGGRSELGVNLYSADAGMIASGGSASSLRIVEIPGLGTAFRRAISEWPGNRPAGWIYMFAQGRLPMPDYVAITGRQFEGTEADYPALRRVLTGDARRRICPHP